MISNKKLILFAILGTVAVVSAAKNEENNDVSRVSLMEVDGRVVKLSDNDNDMDMDNKLMSYEPMMNKIKYPEIEAYLEDLQKSRNYEKVPSQVVPRKESPKLVSMDQKKAAPVMEQEDSSDVATDVVAPAHDETIKLIAHNSREVRLMGPDEREIEMKDDASTRMAVAIDNLKKEAGEAWGQVNTKLDKGWTDFKTMVEDAVEQAQKKKGTSQKTSTLDDVVNGADTAVKTIKDQAEIAGTKIKGFFNNLGVNV